MAASGLGSDVDARRAFSFGHEAIAAATSMVPCSSDNGLRLPGPEDEVTPPRPRTCQEMSRSRLILLERHADPVVLVHQTFLWLDSEQRARLRGGLTRAQRKPLL
jgi:hypothetical protein